MRLFTLFFGALFFNFFYENAFRLYINGNGGFVGQYLSQTFVGDLVNLQTTISFYFLIILILALFLISINFNPRKFWFFFEKNYKLFQQKQ